MKIAQMHRNLGTGGIEALICSLSNELAKANEVTVCTIVQPSPEDKFYKELAPAIQRESIGRSGKGKPFKEMIRIARFIQKGHFDIVHIHGFFYFFALAILLYHRKTCFCYTIHSNALKENNPWDLRILFFKRYCFRHGWVHPITISPTSQDSFTELYGCSSRMIPNGVALPNSLQSNVVDSLRIHAHTKVFIHASRICPEKNQMMLCKVFNRLIQDGEDVVLVIAGPIHHHDIFDELSALLSDRIQYIGEREDIPALLCGADGMCLTSFYEGLPIILLESLSAGCIPICTPVGGILDVIENGKNGLLSYDVSEDSYYSTMKSFLALPADKMKRMKKFCIQTGERYSIQATGRLYQDYYSELLSNR